MKNKVELLLKEVTFDQVANYYTKDGYGTLRKVTLSPCTVTDVLSGGVTEFELTVVEPTSTWVVFCCFFGGNKLSSSLSVFGSSEGSLYPGNI